MPGTATRSSRRALVVALALQGFDGPSIAKQANISLRSVRRYLADPTTRTEMRDAERDRLRELTRRAGALGSAGVTILATIASDKGQPAGARVAAARSLVDVMLRLAEHVDLAERVTALETALSERRDGSVLTWPTHKTG